MILPLVPPAYYLRLGIFQVHALGSAAGGLRRRRVVASVSQELSWVAEMSITHEMPMDMDKMTKTTIRPETSISKSVLFLP